jgi:hypothetical protein
MLPYNPEWHDMSNYVVHFTKPSENRTDYDNMMSILYESTIRAANPFGLCRRNAPNIDSQKAVCFSEIPLHLLQRLSQRRGGYGIGFSKQYILAYGGGPIWYVEHNSQREIALRGIIQQAIESPNPEEHLIWTMTPFIDSTGDYPRGSYRFEWEREWRYIGNLNFSEDDVAFLILPERDHERARGFFYQFALENPGPSYQCPYIDLGWDLDRVIRILAN